MAYQRDSEEFQREQAHLAGTCEAVENALDLIHDRVKKLEEQVKDQQKVGSKGLAQLIALRKALTLSESDAMRHNKMLEEAYFGRFDFQVDGENQVKNYYVGHFGFNEADEQGYRVLSWKAPLAEVFYRDRTRIEHLETTQEGDTVSGETLGKRRYLVDGKSLLACEDIISGKAIIDSIASEDPEGERPVDVEDGILMQILSQDTEASLKDIIRSIQAEQDHIIRLPLNRTLVVQGVAGSGKSTVGLHRIAFLLYNYKKALSEDTVLVLVPNPQFIAYIQDLLPMLETEHVKQETYEQLLLKNLELNGKWQLVHLDQLTEPLQKELDISPNVAMLEQYLEKGSDGEIELMQAFANALYNMLRKKVEPIKVEGTTFKISAKEQLALISEKTPFNKMARALQDYTASKLRVYLTEQRDGVMASMTLKAGQQLETKLKEAVEHYNARFMPLDLLKVYKHYLKTKSEVAERFGLKAFEQNAELTMKFLEHHCIERKDLAALMQLKLAIEGKDKINRFRHIFVDEAQDYGPQEVWVIRQLSENHSITLMGDIHQGIYRHRGLRSWQDITDGVLADLKPELLQLRDSYRSTWEIVDYANALIEDDDMKARPVMRRGEPVTEIRGGKGEVEQGLIDFVYACEERKFRTIAVICQTPQEVKALTKLLEKRKGPFAVTGVTEDRDRFTEGISVITVDRCKGLEFDAAFVYDASEAHYPTAVFVERRRLYVALSRAKHYLWVSYIE